MTTTATVPLRTNSAIKPATRRENHPSSPPSEAETERKNEKARQETEALLGNPRAKRYSRDDFMKWVDKA